MKKRKIKGVEYVEYETGVLMPASYLREAKKVRTPEDVVPLTSAIKCESQECLMSVFLDGSNSILGSQLVTKGLANEAQAHPREVFRSAIRENAVSIILVHNHPSGNLTASQADISTTKKMVAASKIIEISILDHLIVSANGHTSMREFYPEIFA